jgi:hypothetical protein
MLMLRENIPLQNIGVGKSIKQLQDQNPDTKYQCDQEYSFCGFIAMGIDINGKQDYVGQQCQRTNGCDEFVIADKFFQENPKAVRREFDKINNHQSNNRS